MLLDLWFHHHKPDTSAMGGGEPVQSSIAVDPRTMELHKLHILKRRQRDEDALFMLLS